MPYSRPIIALILLAIVGCAASPPTRPITPAKPPLTADEHRQRQLLIGTWLSETTTTEGAMRRILSRRSADGAFEVTFLTQHPDGSTETETEAGLWGASGDIYFVLTIGWVKDGQLVHANRSNGYMDDAYRILHVTADEFEYVAVTSDNRFRARRVADDFSFSKP